MTNEYILSVKCPRLNGVNPNGTTYPKTVEAIIKFDDDNSANLLEPKYIMCEGYMVGECAFKKEQDRRNLCIYSYGSREQKQDNFQF